MRNWTKRYLEAGESDSFHGVSVVEEALGAEQDGGRVSLVLLQQLERPLLVLSAACARVFLLVGCGHERRAKYACGPRPCIFMCRSKIFHHVFAREPFIHLFRMNDQSRPTPPIASYD